MKPLGKMPGENHAKTMGNHGTTMGNYGKIMGKPWEIMGQPWEKHGKSWENHGKIMGESSMRAIGHGYMEVLVSLLRNSWETTVAKSMGGNSWKIPINGGFLAGKIGEPLVVYIEFTWWFIPRIV